MLLKYEVTQKLWKNVMNDNLSKYTGCDEGPVENVSWDDIQEFIKKLNQKGDMNFRLPTEAEWEYAARSGGKHERWSGVNNESALVKIRMVCAKFCQGYSFSWAEECE